MNMTPDQALEAVKNSFENAGILLQSLDVKRFPEEVILVAKVDPSDHARAATIGNEVDDLLSSRGFDGFVAVRKGAPTASRQGRARVEGVHDERATVLVRTLQARSRTSEQQPSLSYVRDSEANLAKATAPRHHLVFGRRGAGKTALLLEAKRQMEESDEIAVWVNLQPHRWQSAARTALAIMQEVVASAILRFSDNPKPPVVAGDANRLSAVFDQAMSTEDVDIARVRRLVPKFHAFIRRFTETTGQDLFIFLDDYYFIPRHSQVDVLDLLHASVRDARCWLKIATIRHLSHWFDPSQQMGLQLGHDADPIDLDVTLQDPKRAKGFLEEVLRSHATKAQVSPISKLFSAPALDRLVLASGSVPRDYLNLAASAILEAQGRSSARLVGVQDVNRAAGDAAQTKIQELDEDLSADSEWAQRTRQALERLRSFCLDEKRYTYFRVSHRDKDERSEAYEGIASLMDLRLIHLLNPAVSHEKQAGVRHEVYLLDLSQYSGDRLRKNIHVLDFAGGHIVQKETGRAGTERVGDTARRLLQILRRGPEFDLAELDEAMALQT